MNPEFLRKLCLKFLPALSSEGAGFFFILFGQGGGFRLFDDKVKACLKTMNSSWEKVLQEGATYHQRGEFKEAERCYRALLADNPNQPDGLHLLGLLGLQVGNLDPAEQLVTKAIRLSPKVGNYWNSLGEIHRAKRKWKEAENCYRKAYELDPSQWQALSNEGLVLIEKRDYDAAIERLKRASEMKGSDCSALINLSNAYLGAKEYDEVIDILEKVTRSEPRNWQAWTNMSIACRKNRDRGKAKICIEKAMQIRPDDANVLTAYGTLMVSMGEWKKALMAYKTILEKDPQNIDALINIASVNKEFDKQESAITYYEKALELDPDHSVALLGLTTVYQKTNRLVEARALAQNATRRHPQNPDLWSSYARIERLMGNADIANEFLEKAISLDAKKECAGFGRLFFYNYDENITPLELREKHEEWAERYAAQYYPSDLNGPAVRKSSSERLRVGFVSGDWQLHPVAQFTESLLRYQDREKYELFCYSTLKIPGARTGELSKIPEHWREVAFVSDEDFCDRVREDRIHVLVDLQGHTSASRLFAHARLPAPVQITYLGYPNTTGLKTMHFRLTDALADPVGMTEDHYVERLYRLKDCAWCFTPWSDTPPVEKSPTFDRGYVTFGCFNNFFKINESLRQSWCSILRDVPNSRLVLKSKSFADDEVARILKERFFEAGIESNRVECSGWTGGIESHLKSYGEIDIALDTYPYHGTTTTCEALYMGVPVVSLAGRTHVSRVGVSLLTNVGLEDLIADSREAYVAKAVELANNPEKLVELRQSLRQRMESSPLMDGPGFAKRFGEALEEMYEIRCGGAESHL